ncbi:MAG: D-glycero-beta-D-manno-heptose 1-phosphate adenylyltransferase [Bacteroidales bacterium]|nr:D-glycero-beta-D-manno-heptose 1-phosphate adenylyltransferase [Bacteroidales bacterium]
MSQLTDIERKIVTLPQLQDILRHRHFGEWVVFTNGCFDILHRGHLTYLAAARDLGGVLVVGLNSDASVRRLKGPSRPVNDERSRALLLAALQCVDYVTLFDEDTPLNLISAIMPDVLAKGGDYTRDTIVGASLVESHGGKVVTLPLVDGFSTTKVIEKVSSQTTI